MAGGLCRFLNLAATDAGRANAKPLGGAFDNGSHGLQVQIPAAFGDVVGVADLIAELRTPATHFANSCHYGNLLKLLSLYLSSGRYCAATSFAIACSRRPNAY